MKYNEDKIIKEIYDYIKVPMNTIVPQKTVFAQDMLRHLNIDKDFSNKCH